MPQQPHNFILLSCSRTGCSGVLGFLAPGTVIHTTRLSCPVCGAVRTIGVTKQAKESAALNISPVDNVC